MENHIEQLTKLFLKFPGIGARQAKRFAYFIMTSQESYVKNLANNMLVSRNSAQTCSKCLRLYEGAKGVCEICSDTKRDQSKIVIIEKSSDIEIFLKTNYDGVFFVLGSLIPITQKSVIENTNTSLLIERVKNDKNIKELILAFPLTPNGDHTDSVLREMMALYPLEINSLGRGLSTGTELEYADPASLEASLKKRE